MTGQYVDIDFSQQSSVAHQSLDLARSSTRTVLLGRPYERR
jgi:hypothetical protein